MACLLAGCEQKTVPAICQRVAVELQAGKLKPDGQGAVRLPTEFAEACVDGRAFITTNQTGVPWLLLRTWVGKGANLTGYLFAPGLQAKAGNEFQVITDAAGIVAPVEVTVENAMNKSWFIVHRGED
jgi:hypothetical protein